MRPIHALTGAALTLALLTGAALPAAAASTGSTAIKDPAGDHRAVGMIKNARAAEADLRKVRLSYNADHSLTATFTLADLRRKRTGTSPTGVQQAVHREYEMAVVLSQGPYDFGIAIGYSDPTEGKPVAGTKPYVNLNVSDPSAFGNLQCDEGSVKFNEAKNTVVINVPAPCHTMNPKAGYRISAFATTEVSVKYYDKVLANGTGGGLVGKDDAWPAAIKFR